MTWDDVAGRFEQLTRSEERSGMVAAIQVEKVHLLPQQQQYLGSRLEPITNGGGTITAVALALAFDPRELQGIPGEWGDCPDRDAWNRYAQAYLRLNEAVNRVAARLAADFGGIAEGATLEGRAGHVERVSDYYSHCVSHRAFAAAAGLGWIGRHGLLVTPEVGPAVRLGTVFIPGVPAGSFSVPDRQSGCGSCRACLDACPILARAAEGDAGDVYRERCLRRIRALALEADVCGICVRACLEAVRPPVT